MNMAPESAEDVARLMAWQAAAGADEAILETPVDRYRASKAPAPARSAGCASTAHGGGRDGS